MPILAMNHGPLSGEILGGVVVCILVSSIADAPTGFPTTPYSTRRLHSWQPAAARPPPSLLHVAPAAAR